MCFMWLRVLFLPNYYRILIRKVSGGNYLSNMIAHMIWSWKNSLENKFWKKEYYIQVYWSCHLIIHGWHSFPFIVNLLQRYVNNSLSIFVYVILKLKTICLDVLINIICFQIILSDLKFPYPYCSWFLL